MKKIFCVVSSPEKFGRGHYSRQLQIQNFLKSYGIEYSIEFNSRELRFPLNINECVLLLDISSKDDSPSVRLLSQFAITVGFDWSRDFIPDYNIVVVQHPNRKYCAKKMLTSGLKNFIVQPKIEELRHRLHTFNCDYVLISLGYNSVVDQYLQAISNLEILGDMRIIIATGTNIDIPYIKNLQVLVDPPNFIELMAGAKVVISNGGTTYVESLLLGKPVLPIPQSEEEKYFVNELESLTARNSMQRKFRKLDFEKAAKVALDTHAFERIGQLLMGVL